MSASASLGNNTVLRNPPPLNNTARFALQDHARDILGGRLKACCRSISTIRKFDTSYRTAKTVQVMQHISGSLSYGNLMHCESVWTCPVCSAHIVAGRRKELSDLIDAVYAHGKVVSMLTLTTRHTREDSLDESLQKISKAKRLMQNRKPWKKFKADFSVVGDVRTLEVTYGSNGWHPHFHILLVSSEIGRKAKPDLEQRILGMWSDALVSVGLSCNENGVDFTICEKRSSKALGDYIAKFGIDFEMTMGGHSKKGAGRSPFKLLADSMNGDVHAKHLFVIYANAFKNKKQLVYSRGLRALLGLADEKTDAEILETGEDSKLVYTITWPIWLKICRYNLRGAFLDYLSAVLIGMGGNSLDDLSKRIKQCVLSDS